MAPDNNNFYEVNLEFPNNTGPMLDGLEKISGVLKDSRDDIRAFNDAMSDTIGKASQIKEFFTGSVDQVEKMKTLLEVTSTIIQGNQSLLSNNLTAINEIISSVKGMGGNIGQAMSVLGLAGAPIQNIMSGAAPTASQDFSYMENAVGNVFEPVGDIKLPAFLGRDKVESNRDILNDGQVSGPPIGDGVSKTPAGNARRKILERDYPELAKRIPEGMEGRAAELGYATMRNKLDSTLGTSGIGGYFNRHFTNILSTTGINASSIRSAQRESVEPVTEIGPGGAVIFKKYPAGHPREGQVMYQPKDEYGDTESKTMKTVDKILGHMEVGIGASVMKAAGYLNVGMEAYNALHDVTKFIRPLAQYAQQQGQLMGQVNYAQTAGNALKDFFASGFDLNPFYGFSEIAASRNNAYALGFRGGNVDQYMGIASQFKQQYGLSQNQTMQMIGGGLAYGVNQYDVSSNYGTVANLVKGSQTSSQYAQQAYQQGMQQAASYGANSAAAAQIGVSSAQFGAGNFIAMGAGMTGMELIGTPLMNALMSQQMGVGYLDVSSSLSKMSGNAITTLNDKTIVDILSNSFGINTAADADRNQQLLQMVLPGLGVPAKEVSTPQKAATWVKGILKRHKNETNRHTIQAAKDLAQAKAAVKEIDKQENQAYKRGDISSGAAWARLGDRAHDALNAANTEYNAGMAGHTKLEIKLHPSVQHLLTVVVNNPKYASTNGSQPLNTLNQ